MAIYGVRCSVTAVRTARGIGVHHPPLSLGLFALRGAYGVSRRVGKRGCEHEASSRRVEVVWPGCVALASTCGSCLYSSEC